MAFCNDKSPPYYCLFAKFFTAFNAKDNNNVHRLYKLSLKMYNFATTEFNLEQLIDFTLFTRHVSADGFPAWVSAADHYILHQHAMELIVATTSHSPAFSDYQNKHVGL